MKLLHTGRCFLGFVLLAGLVAADVRRVEAQPLNWDGATGGWLNPWSYVSPSSKGMVGKPTFAYHYLNAGNIVGDMHGFSATVGFSERFEAGFTRGVVNGPTPGVSENISYSHGKWLAITEGAGGRHTPAVALGAVYRRSGARDLSTVDFYVVGTKIVKLTPRLPALVSLGGRSTEALIYGIAGEAPDRDEVLFGTVALVLNKQVTVGAEFHEQPVTQTTTSYFVRLQPFKKHDVHVVLGFATAERALGAKNKFVAGVTFHGK